MHLIQHGPKRYLVAAGAAFALCASVSPAWAYHDRDTPPVNDSAYTLKQGEFQLGLVNQKIGVFDRFQVGLVLGGYIVGAFTDVFLPNLGFKVRIFEAGDFTFGAGTGLVYARFRQDTETAHADLFALPSSIYTSWRPENWFIGNLEVSYVWVKSVGGASDVASTDDLNGAVTVSSLMTGLDLLFPVTRVTSIGLRSRLLLYQTPIVVESDTQVDDYTTASLNANASVQGIDLAWQIVPSVFFSWKYFNLRVGVGYGNVFLPSLGLVIPDRSVVPELEMYFRF